MISRVVVFCTGLLLAGISFAATQTCILGGNNCCPGNQDCPSYYRQQVQAASNQAQVTAQQDWQYRLSNSNNSPPKGSAFSGGNNKLPLLQNNDATINSAPQQPTVVQPGQGGGGYIQQNYQ